MLFTQNLNSGPPFRIGAGEVEDYLFPVEAIGDRDAVVHGVCQVCAGGGGSAGTNSSGWTRKNPPCQRVDTNCCDLCYLFLISSRRLVVAAGIPAWLYLTVTFVVVDRVQKFDHVIAVFSLGRIVLLLLVIWRNVLRWRL